MRVTVAQRRDRDTGGEVEITSSVGGEQIGAFTTLEREIDPGIDR
jgi:hypothetical protein